MVVGAVMGGMAGGAVVSIVVRGVDSFSGTFAKAATGLGGLATAAGVAGVAIAAGLAVIGTVSVKTFAKVETGFAKVNTLLGEGVDSYDLYGDSIRKVSNEMGLQGGEVSALNGLYQTISAGITDTAKAEEFLLAASTAAVGGSAELSSIINVGTKTMAAFGDEAGSAADVMDTFAAAVVAGQTTMPELANAFPKVAGLAAEMGMSLDETAGAFAGLTKVLANSDVTATGMKATLTQLLKPQQDLQNGLKAIGFESGKAAIEELGLIGTLEALQDSVGGNVVKLGEMFGNVRAITSVLPAVGKASDGIAKSMDILANKTGLSNKQFDDMNKTAGQGFIKLKNTAAGAFTDLGRIITPALLPLVSGMADFFASIDTSKITNFMSIMKNGLLPVWKGFKGVLETISPVVKMIWSGLKTMFSIILPPAREFVGKILVGIKQIFTDIVEKIVKYKPQIESMFKNMGILGAIVFDVLGSIFSIVMSIWDVLVGLGFLDLIIWSVTTYIKLLTFAWDLISRIFQGIAIFFKFMPKALESTKNFFMGFFKFLGNEWYQTVSWVKSIWDMLINVKNFIKGGFVAAFGVFKTIIDKIGDGFGYFVDKIKSAIGFVKDLASAIGDSAIGNFFGSAIGGVSKAIDFLKFDDFMIAPGGQPMSISPNDTIVGYKGDSPFGGGMIVNIENIYGTDPSEMATALEENLMEKISL